jgi:hypothetical protein
MPSTQTVRPKHDFRRSRPLSHTSQLTGHVLYPQPKLQMSRFQDTNISAFTSPPFPSSVIYSIFTPKESRLDVMQPLPKHYFLRIFSNYVPRSGLAQHNLTSSNHTVTIIDTTDHYAVPPTYLTSLRS